MNSKISTLLKYHFSLPKDEMIKISEKDVFDDTDFIRQVEEVTLKLKLPKDVVESVIKSFIINIVIECCKVKKHLRRIKIYGYLHIDILELKYNPYSILNKKNKKN